MYPEFTFWSNLYLIDNITPFIGLILFILILYKVTKLQNLRFRDIVSQLPIIVIVTLLAATYSNFVLKSWHFLPSSISQIGSLVSLSTDSIEFIGLLVGCLIASMFVISNMPHKTRHQWRYVLMLTYLCILVPLGILYTLGDSVIGKFNQWFFSVGSFVQQSRIAQLWWSVYPIGLMISAWSVCCIGLAFILHARYPKQIWYRICAVFMIGYIIILHYQHYPRYMIVNRWWLQMDLRSYCCIAIACIAGYFSYTSKSKLHQ